MRRIIVLGGYGRLGRLVARELLETTPLPVIVAGPNIQRAERVATALGTRVRAAYADASNPSTLEPLVAGGAPLLIPCCPELDAGLAGFALERRLPILAPSGFRLDPRAQRKLEERAWAAQVPMVLHAGALPGLPGMLAELLVRRFPELHEIRLAAASYPGVAAIAARRKPTPTSPPTNGSSRSGISSRLREALHPPRRWRFPAPIGARWLRAVSSPDLEGFRDAHCVEQVVYLGPGEPVTRLIRSAPEPAPGRSFALVAEAYRSGKDARPAERWILQGSAQRSVAAAAIAVIARRLLQSGTPGGFLRAHEALHPGAFLEAIRKRGVRVTCWSPASS